MSTETEASVVGTFIVAAVLFIGLPLFIYDKTTETRTTEAHEIVSTATDARTYGGKIQHKYQVEILVTKYHGEFYKIDCPLKTWVEAKEGDIAIVNRRHGRIFGDTLTLSEVKPAQ